MPSLSQRGIRFFVTLKVITWQNSCRHFDYDPFKHIDRKDSTVGALRAQAPDVDISTKSRAEWRKLYEARETAAHAVG